MASGFGRYAHLVPIALLRAALSLLVLLAGCLVAQEQAERPEADAPDYSFWSGTVTELEDAAVTVRRSIAGRKPEMRRFLINDETIVEGELRSNARVTVAFVEAEDGDLAKRILVRSR